MAFLKYLIIISLVLTFHIFPGLHSPFLQVCNAQQEEEQLEELLEEPAPAPKKEKQKVEEELQEPANELEEFQQQKPAEVMEDAPPSQAEKMKYFRETYEDTFDVPFEEVWTAVQKSLEDKFCQLLKKNYSQTDEGLYKGSVISDFCVFSSGSDSTFTVLKKYSMRVPMIRGGVWITGRFQYKFVITEKEDGSVHLLLKGEVSGFEQYVTGQVHFWDSNGYLETMMLRKIRENVLAESK